MCPSTAKGLRICSFCSCRRGPCSFHGAPLLNDIPRICLQRVFGGSAFLVQEVYASDCESRLGVTALLASGSCEQVITYVEDWDMLSTLLSMLAMSLSPVFHRWILSRYYTQLTILNTNECDENNYRWKYYSNNTTNRGQCEYDNQRRFYSTWSSRLCRYRQRLSRSDANRENAYLNHDLDQQRLALGNKAPVFDRPQSQPDPWNDDAILTRRIHRGAVETQRLLGRGGCGEVYEGVYNGQRVAVKMLPVKDEQYDSRD
ncbi:Protein kinase-like domain [Phytophthora cactorum]|nr:Protein kinase-like domain [Phytophthora cactorum]